MSTLRDMIISNEAKDKPSIQISLQALAEKHDALERTLNGTWSFVDEACAIEKAFCALLEMKPKDSIQQVGLYRKKYSNFNSLCHDLDVGTPNLIISGNRFTKYYRKETKKDIAVGIGGTGLLAGVGGFCLVAAPPFGAMILAFAGWGTYCLGREIKDERAAKKAQTYESAFAELAEYGAQLDKKIGYYFDMDIEPKRYKDHHAGRMVSKQTSDLEKALKRGKKRGRFFN